MIAGSLIIPKEPQNLNQTTNKDMETTNSLSRRKFIASGAIVLGGMAAGLPAMAGIIATPLFLHSEISLNKSIVQNEGWYDE